jgi:hypothetical protein
MDQNQTIDPNQNQQMGTEEQTIPVIPQTEEKKEEEIVEPTPEAPASENNQVAGE